MFVNYVPNITITNVSFVLRFMNAPIGVNTIHADRERWAIMLKLGGKTIYTINEKKVLSDASHAILIPKGSSYSWKCVAPGECIIIEFDAPETFNDIFCFKLHDNSFIVNAFLKVEKLLNYKNPEYILESKALIYTILSFLTKSAKSHYVSKDKRQILQPAIDYIFENYHICNITNDLLAKLCSMSCEYFRKSFEKAYGTSPIKYLNTFRINKAKAMLKSDFESISQVAQSVGYSNVYHFSKMFKLYTGASPTEYAKTSRV